MSIITGKSDFVRFLAVFEGIREFFCSHPDYKSRLLQALHQTNFGVVSSDLLEDLATKIYQDKVHGKDRVSQLHCCEINSVEDDGKSVSFAVSGDGNNMGLRKHCDAIFLATGYDSSNTDRLLAPIRHLLVEGQDGFVVGIDHQLETLADLKAKIFLHGYSSCTHGVSEPTISTVARRSESIVKKLVGQRTKELS